MATLSRNHRERRAVLAEGEERPVGDLWLEYTSTTLGTFSLHRNDGRAVFPMTSDEAEWLRQQIEDIYSLQIGPRLF